MASWHIVVIARGLTTTNEALWSQLEQIKQSIVVIDSGASQPLMRRVSKFATYMRIERPAFNWAVYANAGAAVAPRGTDNLLFLHDDVSLTDGADTLPALEPALAGNGIGLAVPHMTGACKTSAQMWSGPWFAPYFHTTEYVSGAVVAVSAKLFREVGGWDDRFTAADWHAPDLQYRLAEAGYVAAVVPSISCHHLGRVTYGDAIKARTHNQGVFCIVHGISSDCGLRPMLPRIAPYEESSECWVMKGTTEHFVRSLGKTKGAVIVDCEAHPSADWNMIVSTVRCSPAIDDRPDVLAVNLAGSDNVKLHDMRRGAPTVITGRRLRLGDTYRLRQQADEIHWGLLQLSGIGDFVMMTPAITRFRLECPRVRIIAHGYWECVTVLENLPQIDEIVWHKERPMQVPAALMDFTGGNGREGMIRWPYYQLGLDPDDDPDRRLHYRVRAEEFDRAVAWLRSIGIRDEPILGLQAHGSWAMKYWEHTAELSRLWQEAGGRVILFATDPNRRPECPGANILPPMSIRDAMAVVSVCDCWMGHDSGPTLVAAAMRIPAVVLVGSHNPRGLLMDAYTENVTVFRAITPDQCHESHGISCRWPLTITHCPLRGAECIGSDCLDAVSAETVMAELEQMPRWSRPLEQRFGVISRFD
jgi:ADP-heptose:LPS heptosyltransferase